MRPLVVLFAGVLALSGCGADAQEVYTSAPPETAAPAPASDDTDEAASDDAGGNETTGDPTDEPVPEDPPSDDVSAQAETCDWDSPVLSADATAPAGQEGDLSALIVGAWQHTHIDSGSGFKPIEDKDIRYVFPSTERMLYCQHVPGVTEYAENGGDISWEENGIVLPNGQVGYTVTAWDQDSIVWKNEYEGSSYLLQRR